jgi:hypothetical protein
MAAPQCYVTCTLRVLFIFAWCIWLYLLIQICRQKANYTAFILISMYKVINMTDKVRASAAILRPIPHIQVQIYCM